MTMERHIGKPLYEDRRVTTIEEGRPQLRADVIERAQSHKRRVIRLTLVTTTTMTMTNLTLSERTFDPPADDGRMNQLMRPPDVTATHSSDATVSNVRCCESSRE